MKKLANIGCGGRIHADWINIDLVETLPGVIAHDVTKSLPLDTDSCDALYSAAMLEHLPRRMALPFVKEAYRSLKPEGIVRIGVPDSERIARLYLEKLEAVSSGDSEAEADYDWMILEMCDQFVRNRSGGEMLGFLAKPLVNREFVMERIGVEGEEIVQSIRVAYPSGYVPATSACDDDPSQLGRFRVSGEVHQWMYDRFSLGRLLAAAGFSDLKVRSPRDSAIENWEAYHLDVTRKGQVIKPDLLFMEGRKSPR